VSSLLQSKAFRAFPIVCLVIALVADVAAFVGGIQLMSQSVVGGIAVVMIALTLFGLVSWRISFKWKQLRQPSSSP
jgi:hypothetical protein